MSATNVKIVVPPVVREPRAARWVGLLAEAVVRAGRALHAGLESQGRRRAGRALLAQADAVAAHDPAMALQWRLAGRALLEAPAADAR